MVTCRKTVGPEAQYEHAAQYKDGQEVPLKIPLLPPKLQRRGLVFLVNLVTMERV